MAARPNYVILCRACLLYTGGKRDDLRFAMYGEKTIVGECESCHCACEGDETGYVVERSTYREWKQPKTQTKVKIKNV